MWDVRITPKCHSVLHHAFIEEIPPFDQCPLFGLTSRPLRGLMHFSETPSTILQRVARTATCRKLHMAWEFETQTSRTRLVHKVGLKYATCQKQVTDLPRICASDVYIGTPFSCYLIVCF